MRRLVRMLLVSTAVAVSLPAAAALSPGTAAAAAASATSAGNAPVRVLTCSGRAVVRPSSYVLACADANEYFDHIHWTRWGNSAATGSAIYVKNTCTPTCAGGHFVDYPARLTLSEPKRTKDGKLFSVIRYRYTSAGSSTLPLEPLSAAKVRARR